MRWDFWVVLLIPLLPQWKNYQLIRFLPLMNLRLYIERALIIKAATQSADFRQLAQWLRGEPSLQSSADFALPPAVANEFLRSHREVAEVLDRWSWWEKGPLFLGMSMILRGDVHGHELVLIGNENDKDGILSIWPNELIEYANDWPTSVPGGGLVLDIGGHVGITAILLAKFYPTARVISYEPVPINRFYFELNCALNNITNEIVIRNEAVTEDPKDKLNITWNFFESTAASAYAPGTVSLTVDHGLDETFSVKTTSLNKIIAGIPANEPVHVLKLDCEGCEVDTSLALSNDTLDRFGYVFGEVHPSLEDKFRKSDLVKMRKLMCARGWRMTNLDCSGTR